MDIQIVVTQMIIIFIMMFVGFLFMRRGIVDDSGVKQFSSLVVNICNPALLITSAFNEENTATNQEVLVVAIIAFCVFVLMTLFGRVIGPLLRAPKDDWDYYCLMTMFGNLGFIGIPLTTAILGSSSLIFIAVFNLMFYVFLYTYGIYLLAKKSGQGGNTNWRMFVNTGTIASAITVVVFVFKIPVPTIAADSLTYMGNATVFLAIFVIGTSLAKVSLREIFTEYRLYAFILIRFIFIPMLTAFAIKMFTDNLLIIGTTVMMTAVPVGNMPLMLAKERNLDAGIVAKGIILSTILSLITIPIVSLFV